MKSIADSSPTKELQLYQLFRINKCWLMLPVLAGLRKKQPPSHALKIAMTLTSNSLGRRDDHSLMNSWRRGNNCVWWSWVFRIRPQRSNNKRWVLTLTHSVTRVHTTLTNKPTCLLLDLYRGQSSMKIRSLGTPIIDRMNQPIDSAQTMSGTEEALTITLQSMMKGSNLTHQQRS